MNCESPCMTEKIDLPERNKVPPGDRALRRMSSIGIIPKPRIEYAGSWADREMVNLQRGRIRAFDN